MRSTFKTLARPWLNKTVLHILIHRGKTDHEVISVCARMSKGKTNPHTILEEIWKIKNTRPSWF